MSVYNGEKYLKKSIDSILGQSYPNYEYIIVNDGSNDNTKSILESISDSRIKIIHQDNIGLTASLNKGILLSKGEYIARQDADDISLVDRLEKQVEYFENNKDYVLAGTNSYLINEINEHIGIYQLPRTDTEIRWTILFRNPFCHSTIMIRGNILRNNQILYNEDLKTAQDFDFLYRIIKYGKTENMEIPLVEYRVHPDQMGKLYNSEQQKNALLISKMNLANIGFNLSEDEVIKLRKWAYEFPASINKGDIYFCELLLRILNKFKMQPFVDKNIFKSIKNSYISKICNAINRDNIYDVLLSSLFIHVIYGNGSICLNKFSDRIFSRLIEIK